MKPTLKVSLLWVLFVVAMLFMLAKLTLGAKSKEVPFSSFMEYAKASQEEAHASNIHISNRDITFDLIDPKSKAKEPQHLTTVGPPDSFEMMKDIGAGGREITFSDPGDNITFSKILPYVLLFLLGGALLVFIMRQMQNGGGKAMSFGKSRARLLNENNNKVTFADVAGAEEAKEEVEELVAFLREPKKFQKLGGRIPKGALMVGPPGTGKTLLARAIAGEAGVPFFTISGSDFVEMFVGVGASRVRDLFEQAKKQSPCLIFIDEIDAVGRQRGAGLGGGHDEREQTLNQLLVEMDGFEHNDGVIVIAATNRPDVLDPAILRPGRFDRRITVPRPDLRGRHGILGVHTRKVPLGTDVDLEKIAAGLPGFVGADLENLVNEAALLAARQDKDSVTMLDFEMAKDKVLMGVERRSMVMSDQERRTTAWHEAGHTLVGLLVPGNDPVHKVTIIPRGQALGVTMFLPAEDRYTMTKKQALARIAMALGGRVAEDIVFGEITTGAANDIKQATKIAKAMVCEYGMSEALGPVAYGEREGSVFLGRDMGAQRDDFSEETARLIDSEVKTLITKELAMVHQLLTDNRGALDRIAEALLERETIDQEEIQAAMAGQPLPDREQVIIPTYADRRENKEKRRSASIFGSNPGSPAPAAE